MSAGESKGGDKLSENLGEFKANIVPGDKVAVFTLGRFHPVTEGHVELIRDVMETAEKIRTSVCDVCSRKPSVSVDTFIWLSPTNVEEGWYHNPEISELKERAKVASSDQGRRLIGREQKITKTKINKTEPHSTAIRVVTLNAFLMEFPIKPTILIDYQRTIDDELEEIKNTYPSFIKPISIRERHGQLYSIRLLNWLRHSRGFNKVILLVGSDRVKAFKKYNNDLIKKLFDDGIILKSGGERGAAGNRDASIDELTRAVKKLAAEGRNPDSHSGSISRKLITEFILPHNVPPINIKAFLRQQGWKKKEDTPEKRKQTIAQINQIRSSHNQDEIPSSKIEEAIDELNGEIYDDEMGPNPFEKSDFEKGDGGRGTLGGGKRKTRKRKRKRKRKRCSKKRLKKKMICHRGTKKKLRKLRKLTKKLKIRLTRCSKKRLKKWSVKKSRKKR